MKKALKPQRDLFVDPPKFTEDEARRAFDDAHRAMHLTVKRMERDHRTWTEAELRAAWGDR